MKQLTFGEKQGEILEPGDLRPGLWIEIADGRDGWGLYRIAGKEWGLPHWSRDGRLCFPATHHTDVVVNGPTAMIAKPETMRIKEGN